MSRAEGRVAPLGDAASSDAVDLTRLDALAGAHVLIRIDDLHAGYGRREVLQGVSLRLARGQSLCLVGPNGAGKSTVLHSMFGLTDLYSGRMRVGEHDLLGLSPGQLLRGPRLGYVLQDSSVFPGLSVEENLMMGGYLLPRSADARRATEAILARYPRLAARRGQPAGHLSGGERRLLEIARALMMDPEVLLIDEPSIGLEPRYIESVFNTLEELQRERGTSILMVEQNVRRGLQFADIGYVLVSGRVVLAGTGEELLNSEEVGRKFLKG